MATKAEQAAFIGKIAPLIVKYAAERGYKCVSAAIAQACLESGMVCQNWRRDIIIISA